MCASLVIKSTFTLALKVLLLVGILISIGWAFHRRINWIGKEESIKSELWERHERRRLWEDISYDYDQHRDTGSKKLGNLAGLGNLRIE